MSIAVVLSVPTNRRDELIDGLKAILPDTREFDGCESVNLVADPEDASRVVLIEFWASLDHYNAYKAWRAESGTSILSSDLVAGPPDVATYDVLD